MGRLLESTQESSLNDHISLNRTLRHPQYDAFVLIMLGFLLQWPTLLTLLMFPVLVWMYLHLARSEEKDALAEFGDAYIQYTQKTPAFSRIWDRRVEIIA